MHDKLSFTPPPYGVCTISLTCGDPAILASSPQRTSYVNGFQGDNHLKGEERPQQAYEKVPHQAGAHVVQQGERYEAQGRGDTQ